MHTYIHRKEEDREDKKHEKVRRSPRSANPTGQKTDVSTRSAYDIAHGINITSDGFVNNLLRKYGIDSSSQRDFQHRSHEQSTTSNSIIAPSLQREAGSAQGGPANAHTTSPEIENKIESMRRSGGAPLDNTTREFMESRMGHDFSNVRIHTGSDAESTSKDLNAKAYTLGNDIAFNKGEYQPETNEGKKLIAHELTHTVQQGAVRRKSEQADLNKSRTPERVQRTAGVAVIQRRALSGWRLRKGTAFNRKTHKFTDGLAYRLVLISGNYELYNRAIAYARRRLGVRRVNGTLQTIPGHAGIGDDFTRLVASAQRKIPMRPHGWLDWPTRTKAAAWKKPRTQPKSTLGKIAQYTLDGAIWLIKKIPDKWFLPTGVIGLLFKHGAIGFLRAFAKQGGEAVIKMAWRIAKALASWSFVKNYVISFVKGFFVDGLWGTLKLIWQIIKLPYTIGKFAWKIANFIADLDLGKALGSINKGIVSAATWILNNGVKLVDGIKNFASKGDKKSISGFLQKLYNGATGMLQKGGAKLAGYLIKFFNKDSKESGAAMGRTVGRFGGSIIFDVLLGVATVGGSAAISAIARIIRPVFGWLQSTGKRAVSVAASVWNKVWSLTQIISSKVLGWIKGVSPTLANKLRFVVVGMRRFFRRLMKGIKKRKSSGKNTTRDKTPDAARGTSKKAQEYPQAIAAAKGIAAAQDKLGTRVEIVASTLLATLKPRFKWIKAFGFKPRGPNRFTLWMKASPEDDFYGNYTERPVGKEIDTDWLVLNLQHFKMGKKGPRVRGIKQLYGDIYQIDAFYVFRLKKVGTLRKLEQNLLWAEKQGRQNGAKAVRFVGHHIINDTWLRNARLFQKFGWNLRPLKDSRKIELFKVLD